jgi:glutathione synthase/RimK-type ligase-like ATP-grasp enzyme
MTTTGLPRHVALLSGGPPISLKVLYCLQRLGIQTDVVDIDTPSIARFSRYKSGYTRIAMPTAQGPGAAAGFADALQTYIRARGIDGVIAGDIPSTALLHQVRGALQGVTVYPTSDAETLEMLDDKWRFQQFLTRHGLPAPRAELLQDVDQLSAVVGQLGFPLVVKPLYGESSHGIAVVDDADALYRHLQTGSKYTRLPLLLQEYVRGYDADISVLAQGGEVICHVLHARRAGCTLEFMHSEEALQVARQIVAASGFTGVANIDLRIDEASGKVTVIECNPRFWYTLQASLWRGVNFVEAGFRLMQGARPEIAAPSGGRYHLHGCLMKHMLWNPLKWSGIEGYNLRGLYQALADPMPFLRR